MMRLRRSTAALDIPQAIPEHLPGAAIPPRSRTSDGTTGIAEQPADLLDRHFQFLAESHQIDQRGAQVMGDAVNEHFVFGSFLLQLPVPLPSTLRCAAGLALPIVDSSGAERPHSVCALLRRG
ncbi:MAG: hypothetical protein KatS3mg106_814 [Gemmataceae bacterium]|nr:MAG: hypothetical protein KatS3mg106_814 [Gemmataceae bacterium]